MRSKKIIIIGVITLVLLVVLFISVVEFTKSVLSHVTAPIPVKPASILLKASLVNATFYTYKGSSSMVQ